MLVVLSPSSDRRVSTATSGNRRFGCLGSGSPVTPATPSSGHCLRIRSSRCHRHWCVLARSRYRSDEDVRSRAAPSSRRRGLLWSRHAYRLDADRLQSRARAGPCAVALHSLLWIEGSHPGLDRGVAHIGAAGCPPCWRCSDGRLLHFWFPPTGPSDFSDSAEAEASRAQHQAARAAARLERGGGSLTATLRPRALSRGLLCGGATPCAEEGSFMFSSPGKWVVQAQQGRRVVGTAVFDFHG